MAIRYSKKLRKKIERELSKIAWQSCVSFYSVPIGQTTTDEPFNYNDIGESHSYSYNPNEARLEKAVDRIEAILEKLVAENGSVELPITKELASIETELGTIRVFSGEPPATPDDGWPGEEVSRI